MATGILDSGDNILLISSRADTQKSIVDICSDYSVLIARNRKEAEIYLSKLSALSLIFIEVTDIHSHGWEVLKKLNEMKASIPVIALLDKKVDKDINKALDLHVYDVIVKPFIPSVVLTRARNATVLHSRFNKLVEFTINEVYESVLDTRLMILILSQIVEFRNGEGGNHVRDVSIITKLLMEALLKLFPGKYNVTKHDIELISLAACLHDIGKVYVPVEILNKPGKFTPEEFDITKSHTVLGWRVLDKLGEYSDRPLMRFAKDICLGHHEKVDGKGYPNGLTEEQIPIWTQIVSVADCYDALTHKRCYKPEHSHETAIRMIKDGECGAFGADALACLDAVADDIKNLDNAPTYIRQVTREDVCNAIKAVFTVNN